MRNLAGFLGGLAFGLGLVVPGLADPAEALDVLDLAGAWNPSLAFAMAGAAALGHRLARRWPSSVLAGAFDLPTRSEIDRPLILGSTLFGVSGGIGGFRPGPARTALPLPAPGALAFLPALLLGLWLGSHGKALPMTPSKGAME